jgi:long-chain acyl-CoA synthetase
MNLATAFADTAAQCASRTALFWGSEQITYGRLLEQSRGVARQLATDFGVRHGDRVGLWLKNSPEFVPALFGPLEAGAAVVNARMPVRLVESYGLSEARRGHHGVREI